MTNFIKLESTRTSTILESIELERVFLFSQCHALFKALAWVFGLLLLIRFSLIFFYLGAFPIFDLRVPLSTAWAAFLFMLTFAMTGTFSFVVVLMFSSTLGMSASTTAVRSVFCGMTAYLSVLVWQSQIPWFFCGLLLNPLASYGLACIAMLVACIQQPDLGLVNRKTNPLRIKHLLAVTTFFAVILACVPMLFDTNIASQILKHLPIYLAAQIAVTCCSELFLKLTSSPARQLANARRF